jgi:hypothetical protein
MGPISRPETSVTDYKSTLRNISEERTSHLYRGGRQWSSSAVDSSDKITRPYSCSTSAEQDNHLQCNLQYGQALRPFTVEYFRTVALTSLLWKLLKCIQIQVCCGLTSFGLVNNFRLLKVFNAFRTSVYISQTTQCNIPEHMNHQQRHCGHLTPRILKRLFLSFFRVSLLLRWQCITPRRYTQRHHKSPALLSTYLDHNW